MSSFHRAARLVDLYDKKASEHGRERSGESPRKHPAKQAAIAADEVVIPSQ